MIWWFIIGTWFFIWVSWAWRIIVVLKNVLYQYGYLVFGCNMFSCAKYAGVCDVLLAVFIYVSACEVYTVSMPPLIAFGALYMVLILIRWCTTWAYIFWRVWYWMMIWTTAAEFLRCTYRNSASKKVTHAREGEARYGQMYSWILGTPPKEELVATIPWTSSLCLFEDFRSTETKPKVSEVATTPKTNSKNTNSKK